VKDHSRGEKNRKDKQDEIIALKVIVQIKSFILEAQEMKKDNA
jgi:hypothetical protein